MQNMLIVRGDFFVKRDNDFYFYGSGNNNLLAINSYCMGDIDFLCWYKDDPSIDVTKLEKFIPSPNINLLVYDKKLSFKEKKKIIKKEVKNHTYVSMKMPLKDALLACWYAIRYHKKFVLESAGSAFQSLWYHGGLKYKLAAIPIEMLVKYYHRKAKYIVFVSKFNLQKSYKSKAYQIGCPDVVLDMPKEEVLQKRLSKIEENKNTYYVGLIGATQAEYRGHDILIKAIKILQDKNYDVHIRFLGGGTKDEKRKELATSLSVLDKVEFCGRLPHDKVLDWIDDIDILAMPTKVESLGRAIIEAMSRGCPVVGSKDTAVEEQIGSDCLIEATDYKGLASKIEYLINHKDYMKYCALENFYRSFKYENSITKETKKEFYDYFYSREKVNE